MTQTTSARSQAILFDWGNTVMRNFPSFTGPMHTWPMVEEMPGVRIALELRLLRVGAHKDVGVLERHVARDQALRQNVKLTGAGLPDEFSDVACVEPSYRRSCRRFLR